MVWEERLDQGCTLRLYSSSKYHECTVKVQLSQMGWVTPMAGIEFCSAKGVEGVVHTHIIVCEY